MSIQTTLEKVARSVSGQHGIQVVFQGSQAYTDGKKIVLPSLPADAPADLVRDIQGYLDHELAHVLYSDFPAFAACKNHFHKWLSNHCEDSRIEKIISETFPGTRLHLVPLNVKWMGIIHAAWEKQSLMNRICLAVRAIMDGAEPRLDADTKPLFTKKVVKLATSLRKAKDSWAIVDICGKILREIDQEQKEQEESKDRDQESDQADQADQADQESDQADQADQESDQESDQADQADQESDQADQESEADQESDQADQADQADQEGNGQSKEDGEPEDGSEKGEGKDQAEEDEDGEEADSEYDGSLSSEALQKELEESSEKDCKDIHGYIDSQIEEQVEQEKEERLEVMQKPSERQFDDARRHLPFSTQYDELLDYSKDKSAEYSRIRQHVAATVSKLVVELERIFTVKAEERTILEQERGRISRRGLTRLVTDKNYKTPFKIRLKEETKNVAVQLVIDLSGSMSGMPVYVARLVAAAIAEALAKLEIECEVVGFNTARMPYEVQSQVTDRFRYNRVSECLMHYVFKAFGSKNLEALAVMEANGANCDGESVRFFAKRLEQHKAKRKVMMVLSDGMPMSDGNKAILNGDLKKAVKEITATGIECVGIGIMTDSVKHFYPDYVVVQSLDELVQTALKKLKTILVA